MSGSLYDAWPLICVRMQQIAKYMSQLQRCFSLCHSITGTIEESTKERAVTLVGLPLLLVSANVIVSRALTLTLTCLINLINLVYLKLPASVTRKLTTKS